jgi:glutathione S-transferase
MLVVLKANHFHTFAPVEIPYAKKRTFFYPGYCEQFSMLPRIWMKSNAGMGFWRFVLGTISHAMGTIHGPRIAGHGFAGIETLDKWPNLKVSSLFLDH